MKPLGPNSRPTEWKHSYSCYANHGCRCAVCVDAHRAYWRHRRQLRHSQPLIIAPVPPPDIVQMPVFYRDHDAEWPELVAAVLANREDVL